jgi:hypothetical protein
MTARSVAAPSTVLLVRRQFALEGPPATLERERQAKWAPGRAFGGIPCHHRFRKSASRRKISA